MVHVIASLNNEQYCRLKALADARQRLITDVVSEIIDEFLAAEEATRATLYRQALTLAGAFSGPVDLAAEHDRYLDEAYGSV